MIPVATFRFPGYIISIQLSIHVLDNGQSCKLLLERLAITVNK